MVPRRAGRVGDKKPGKEEGREREVERRTRLTPLKQLRMVAHLHSEPIVIN
jgi:hypothetical protein